MQSKNRSIVWIGIALILATGIIHLVDAPDNFHDAKYKGLLFVLNGIGACIAAVGIYLDAPGWGWGLGILVAAGAFVGYVISRTVGLPGLPVDAWLEPIGVLSLIVEALFIMTAVYALKCRAITRRL